MSIQFLQKASNKQSASVILGLLGLLYAIIDRKAISRGVRLWAAHAICLLLYGKAK